MRDASTSVRLLGELKRLGVRLAIDDFGTGYSSLSYLKRFPIDALKIDQSFVRDIPDDADDAAIASTVIAMAHALRLEVVAEGVETEEQLAFLRSRGCDRVQGYRLGHPQPAAAAGAFVEAATSA
jgi:EAL domain-containing protein (putative c-di-GMP-specific phosphodiesterase class I)